MHTTMMMVMITNLGCGVPHNTKAQPVARRLQECLMRGLRSMMQEVVSSPCFVIFFYALFGGKFSIFQHLTLKYHKIHCDLKGCTHHHPLSQVQRACLPRPLATIPC